MSREEEIKARIAAATAGPWRVEGETWLEVRGTQDPIADMPGSIRDQADAALIANAPADLAYLLSENERLRAAAEQAANAFEDLLFAEDNGTHLSRARRAWDGLVLALDEGREG